MLTFRDSVTLQSAKTAKHRPHFVLQILIFLVVMLAINLVVGLVLFFPLLFWIVNGIDFPALFASEHFLTDYTGQLTTLLASLPSWIVLLFLFATVAETAAAIVYCRCIEGRPLRSLGFSARHAVRRYLAGLGIGLGMVMAIQLLSFLCGFSDFSVSGQTCLPLVLLFLAAFMVQGMAEEVLFRGYLMVSFSNRIPVAAALGVSSVLFALCHLGTPALNLLDFLNLALVGLLMALVFLRTDSIWCAAAIHTAWNFSICCLLGGGPLGGTVDARATFFFATTRTVPGGRFGTAEGLLETAVLLTVLLLVLVLPRRGNKEQKDEIQPSA